MHYFTYTCTLYHCVYRVYVFHFQQLFLFSSSFGISTIFILFVSSFLFQINKSTKEEGEQERIDIVNDYSINVTNHNGHN